jgi:membrane protease subunit HflC
MNRNLLIGAGALAAVVLVLLMSALFTVHQTQQALVLQFGNPKRVITDPGLHVKLPFIQNAIYIDRRVLDFDAESQEVILGDQKRLVVDAFARYKITNALGYYQSVGSREVANSRLAQILNSSVRRVLGESTFEDIVRDDRAQLMRLITGQVNAEAEKFGMTIVDVRIRRADLPEENSQAVYRRMQTEREREANDIRARGDEEARRIRARADREVVVVKAEATRESEVIRGEGDAERNRLYADAYGRDPEFFAFYRSMVAYEQGLKAADTSLVISPDSDFFRYFKDPLGGAAGQPPLPEESAGEADAAGAEVGAADAAAQSAPPAPAANQPVEAETSPARGQ